MDKITDTNKPEIGLYITVFASSIGVWYYLFAYILQLSTEHPSNPSLVVLAVCHSLCFLCIGFCFLLLVNESMQVIGIVPTAKRVKMAKRCRSALFLLWGPMVLFSLICLACSRVIPLEHDTNLVEVVIYITGSVLVVLLFRYVFDFRFRPSKIKWPYIMLIIPYTSLYIVMVSFLSSGVDFKTEKEFYKKDEVLRFAARRKGYVFLPRIDAVNYCGDTITSSFDDTYSLDLKKDSIIRDISWVQVTYTTQLPVVTFYDFFTVFKTKE